MTLRSTIATPEGKRRYVRRLFATIADRYDFITRFLSYGQDRRWKRRLIDLAAIRSGERVLDLACGTGDLTFAALQHTPQVTGLDVTHRMLQLAQRRGPQPFGKLRVAPSNVEGQGPAPHLAGPAPPAFVAGDMLALPFASSRFDVVTTGYGLRNVPDLDAAVGEIHRVLAPHGRLLSLDFNRPENVIVRGAYLVYLTAVGAALGLLLHRDPDTYRYIPESIRQYPGAAGVARLLRLRGFSDVRVVPLLGGLMSIHVARK
jgi:demethylmenaquinone methyltransferase/2-methoxy-6-polyprenyl-1,4-benzoquinol methylase